MEWSRWIRWSAVALVIVVLVLAIGGYALLKSRWMHHYVLAKVVQETETATGGKVEVQNWSLHFAPLSFTLYGITLHGAEPVCAKPLFQTDQLTIGLNPASLLHRKIQLTQLLLQHPVVDVTVGKDGEKNLPTAPSTSGSGTTTVWSLAVGHTVVNNGEIYYNDKKTPLSADLYGLKSEIGFDALTMSYSGSISYQNGHLQYADYFPLTHSMNAEFSANRRAASLKSLVLEVGSSQITAHAEMTDYNAPNIHASYELNLHAQDFASLSRVAVPTGEAHLVGEMRYQSVANQPMLRNITANGELIGNKLQVQTTDARLVVDHLKTQYRLANGELDVDGMGADLANGHVAANLSLQHLDTAPQGTFAASLERLSLASLRQSVSRADVRRMPVTGTIDGKLNGAWSNQIRNIRLSGDIGVRAAVWNDDRTAKSETPIDGDIHVSYDGRRNAIAFRQTTFHIPSTAVVLDGQLSDNSDLRIRATAGDLHQFSALASSLRSASSEPPAQPIAVSGGAVLQVVVQGRMQNPRITGQLNTQHLEVQGSQWKTAQLDFEADASNVQVLHASLVNAKQGSMNFNGQVGLKRWAYLASSPVTLDLNCKGMSVADLEHLANLQYPISGSLSANVSIRGSHLNPSGHGSLRIVNGTAYNQPIRDLNVRFHATNDTIDTQTNVDLSAGSASANLSYTPKTKAYTFDLESAGIVLQKLQVIRSRNLPLTGTLTASARGAGTADNPQLDASFEIPSLQVQQTTVKTIKAQLGVCDQRANLSLTSTAAQSFIRANAIVDLTGDYNANASINTNKVTLDPFIALYAATVPEGFHGETELHAILKGPLKDASKLEAHLTIPELRGSYQSLEFSNAGPIRLDYADSVIVLAPAQIQGTDTSLSFQGRVPMNGGPLTLQAKGNVDLGLLAMFSSDVKSSGTVDLDLHGAGTSSNPQLSGQVQIRNAAFSTSDMPVGLSKLNGTLALTSDKVQIVDMKGQMGGGEISVGGSITYRPNLQFGVALQAKSVRLLYPTGVRTVLDSNLTFAGNMDASTLTGRTLVDSLDFTPDFDLSTFAGQFNGISVPSSGENFADKIKLAVLLQSNQNLSARSKQISLEGIANLQIRGTAADPVITGRVDLTSGELFFMSNRYELQRGIITFDDPNETHPNLNVQVTSTIEQYNLTLTLNGPFDRLATNYVSDPALPTADIISLIYQGETTEQSAAAGTSTDSILASGAASQFSGGLQKLAGISSLQIDPTMGANSSDPSARIALQQRVTKNFLFTFSTDVSQPEAEIVQGEYQINKRWSVSVTRNEVGGIAVDGRYHTKF
ncbi:MAG TPA: translocation/assembly module TamB domain-containing protein [Terriglobales bacterium]